MSRVHPPSVFAGIALVGLVAVTSSVQGSSRLSATTLGIGDEVTVRVAGIPAPDQMMVIREEDGPYTVPVGKLFVVTGIGTYEWNNTVRLFVDARLELTAEANIVAASVMPVVSGLTVRAGSVMSMTSQGTPQYGRVYGYLVDA